MGLTLLSRTWRQGASLPSQRTLRERLGAHFPRLFAYTYSYVGDAAIAREIVTDAFSRAFARWPDLPDNEFRLALFGVAHRLCRSAASAKAPLDDVLSHREREVISLLFDAQLSRREVGCLLKLKEETVISALMRGLKKLRASSASPAVAAYLHLSQDHCRAALAGHMSVQVKLTALPAERGTAS